MAQVITGNDVYDKMFGGKNASWGKSARQVKSEFLQGQTESLIAQGGKEADRLTKTEDSTNRGISATIQQALGPASAPTLTQENIDTQFGAAADAAAPQALERMNSLRDTLGGAGVTGGGIGPAIAAQYEMARMGQITDARRSLMLEKVKQDAADRQRNFNNTLTYASRMKGPSLINMDWLQNVLGVRLGQQGAEAERSAGKDAAAAAKQAGQISGIGNVLGAALGAAL